MTRIIGRTRSKSATTNSWTWSNHESEPHQILGWPHLVEDDPLSSGPGIEDGYSTDQWTTRPADWRLLFQLHYDDSVEIEILDGGSYAFVVPAQDLAAGRYDRLVCDVSSC